MMTFAKKLSPVVLLLMLLTVVCCPVHADAADYSCTVALEVKINFDGNANVPFTVNLAAEDKEPLPQETELTRMGGGTVKFEDITFTGPGDYHYTLTQKKGNVQYVTYDSTVYSVTVRVTNDDKNGTLQAEVWAERNGATGKVSEFAFTNSYDPPAAPSNSPQPTATPVPATTEANNTSASQMSGLLHLPQTGDEFPLVALVVICVAAIGGFGYIIYRKKRGNNK